MSKNDAARKELTSNNISILDIGLHRFSSLLFLCRNNDLSEYRPFGISTLFVGLSTCRNSDLFVGLSTCRNNDLFVGISTYRNNDLSEYRAVGITTCRNNDPDPFKISMAPLLGANNLSSPRHKLTIHWMTESTPT